VRSSGQALFSTTPAGPTVTTRHPTHLRLVAVAFHARDIKRGTLHGILRQAGLSVEEFLKLL